MLNRVKKTLSQVLLSRWVARVLYTSLGVLLGISITYIALSQNIDITTALKSMTPFIIFLSVMLASRQFAYTRQWNQKNAANEALKNFRYQYNVVIQELHPFINLRDKIRHKERLSLEEVHNLMGVFVAVKNKDGVIERYNFVHHGKHTQDDIKNAQIKHSSYRNDFDDNIDGYKMERTLNLLLMEYESIAAGVYEDTYDKDMVFKLLGSTVSYTFEVLINHIYHIRADERHNGNIKSKSYIEFERLANEFSLREGEAKIEIPKEFDYICDF